MPSGILLFILLIVALAAFYLAFSFSLHLNFDQQYRQSLKDKKGVGAIVLLNVACLLIIGVSIYCSLLLVAWKQYGLNSTIDSIKYNFLPPWAGLGNYIVLGIFATVALRGIKFHLKPTKKELCKL